MTYTYLTDLGACIDRLAANGDLVRVRSEVDPVHQLAGIAYRFEGNEVVLCEKVKGHDFPVLVGLYWNRAALARLFGCATDRLPFVVADAVADWQTRPIEPEVGDSGPANEVVELEVDLRRLPIPTHALGDGGPYIDSAIVIARDPDTGVRNASIYRALVTGPDRLTVQLDEGRHVRDYYERVEKRGQPLEVTLNDGVGPAVHVAAIVPSSAAPIEKDELGIASAFTGQPLQLIRSQTVNVEGLADAQFILEAEMLPEVRESEGPFAEVTGYYASQADRWVVRVKKITRRKNPVWQTILSGKEVFNSVGLVGEAAVYKLVSRQVRDVRAVYFSHGGCGFYHAVVQLKKSMEGTPKNAILATFAAFPSLKMVIAVDEDVDITNAEDVEWALATRFRPETGLIQIPAARGHELNPSTDRGLGMKLGIDATAPHPRPRSFERVKMAEVRLDEFDIRK
ncbi:MAG TPA: UbiD family decarboxylase [Anaerolineae bacterium]|nr:UbiD family decarboxylase [Anaerolineae bacterium]